MHAPYRSNDLDAIWQVVQRHIVLDTWIPVPPVEAGEMVVEPLAETCNCKLQPNRTVTAVLPRDEHKRRVRWTCYSNYSVYCQITSVLLTTNLRVRRRRRCCSGD